MTVVRIRTLEDSVPLSKELKRKWEAGPPSRDPLSLADIEAKLFAAEERRQEVGPASASLVPHVLSRALRRSMHSSRKCAALRVSNCNGRRSFTPPPWATASLKQRVCLGLASLTHPALGHSTYHTSDAAQEPGSWQLQIRGTGGARADGGGGRRRLWPQPRGPPVTVAPLRRQQWGGTIHHPRWLHSTHTHLAPLHPPDSTPLAPTPARMAPPHSHAPGAPGGGGGQACRTTGRRQCAGGRAPRAHRAGGRRAARAAGGTGPPPVGAP